MIKQFIFYFVIFIIVAVSLSFYYDKARKKDFKFFAVIIFASLVAAIVGSLTYHLLGGS